MDRCTRCSGELPSFAVFCPHCSQTHEPDFDQLVNLTVDGRYRIYRRMGQGGLSSIFAATDLETDRVVAIKVSDPAQLVRRELSYAVGANQARNYWSEMLERMRREAEALVTIDHPNIVRFYGTDLINDDVRYVVMEFLRGRTLRNEIDRHGRLEMPAATRVALEVSSALREVHSRGIVHRDISPQNIFLCDSGVKLIDFGIAKFPQPPGAPPFTQHSTLSGTVAYASPEQCRSLPVDHRSDIYSLGVVLYEMLTGQRPFNGRTPTEIALKQIQSAPKPPRAINPEILPRLEKTVWRALAKNPDERQQSIEEMADELRAASNQILIPLPSTAFDEDSETRSINRAEVADEPGDQFAEDELKLVRKRRRRFTVTAAAALVLAALTAALLFGRHSINSRNRLANTTEIASAGSPSPSATLGSDADSLELDARMPSQTDGGSLTASPSPLSTSLAQAQSPGSAGLNSTASDRQTDRATTHPATRATAHSPTPAPAPTPLLPKAQPQMPPPPSPTVDIARAPQPIEPDASNGPHRDPENTDAWRRDSDGASGNPDRDADRKGGRNADRHGDYDSNRNRNSDTGGFRRLPDHSDRDDDEDDDLPRIGPKLIQWSGRVNDEREISIEMPGVPGNVEIPRIYRDRVGVVEPPSSNNRWRCAVLRVFGRGNVSFVIRWWPAARNAVRFTARR